VSQAFFDMSASELRQEIANCEAHLKNFRSCLENLERSCQHTWGQTKYTPIEHKAYTIPGDAPGTMGVDWQGPCYVPAETIKQWSRTCTKCGKTETTRATKKEWVAGSIAGTGGMADVPNFGDRPHWTDKPSCVKNEF